jgi:hypothetical protein
MLHDDDVLYLHISAFTHMKKLSIEKFEILSPLVGRRGGLAIFRRNQSNESKMVE